MSHPIEVRFAVPGDPLSEPRVLREIADRYLIWDAFVAGARRVELHPLVLSAELHASAVRAAEDVVRVLSGRVAARAHRDASEAARYGFHPDVDRLIRASHGAGDDASLVRVDLLLDRELRWRACEINADCPGGHNEAYGLPRLTRAAGYAGGTNPTIVLDALVARLAALAGEGGTVGLTFATAYAEDLQVCALLQRALLARGTHAVLVPPTAPRLRDGRLYAGPHALSVLYRFFPTEYMEGQRNIPEIAEAIATGRLRTLSSFAQMYAQSKLVMARGWAQRDALATEDARVVREHVPQTYALDEVPAGLLEAERPRWVVKKALGRVGDDVFVGPLLPEASWRAGVAHVRGLCARGERWIAQRFVEQRPVPTPWGEQYVTLGAYLLDGRFVGYFARVTPASHVSHDALVVPVFAERAA